MEENQNKPPAFQFYVKDWLSDMNVRLMPLEVKGAYIELLSVCWNEGYLPNNDKKISKILQISEKKYQKKFKIFIEKHFFEDENNSEFLINKRLKSEREKQIKNSIKRSEAGKIGALKKWWKSEKEEQKTKNCNNKNMTNAINENMTNAMAKNSSSSSFASSSSIKEKSNKKENSVNQFEEHLGMVETESEIPNESKKDDFDYFGIRWKYYRDQCKQQNRRAGDKGKSKARYKKLSDKILTTQIDRAIINYAEDCLLRGVFLKNLENFLTKDNIEEWLEGSDNHKELLELKNKPQKHVKMTRGFETEQERVNRELQERREQTMRVIQQNDDEVDLPWLDKQQMPIKLIN